MNPTNDDDFGLPCAGCGEITPFHHVLLTQHPEKGYLYGWAQCDHCGGMDRTLFGELARLAHRNGAQVIRDQDAAMIDMLHDPQYQPFDAWTSAWGQWERRAA